MRDSRDDVYDGMEPGEMAQHEYRLKLDVGRLSRLNLIKAVNQAIEAEDINGVAELFPHVIEVLALWKRNEVGMRVMMKEMIRRAIRAEYQLEQAEDDIAKLFAQLPK